jgi:hypothetical protein
VRRRALRGALNSRLHAVQMATAGVMWSHLVTRRLRLPAIIALSRRERDSYFAPNLKIARVVLLDRDLVNSAFRIVSRQFAS